AACGTGAFVPLWLKLGAARVQGLDISDKAVAMCRRRFAKSENCRFQRADLSVPGSGARLGRFDLVCIFEAIFLLTKRDDFAVGLNNLCSWVKPGGHLLITDHFPRQTTRRHDRLTYYSQATYRRIFDQHD